MVVCKYRLCKIGMDSERQCLVEISEAQVDGRVEGDEMLE